MNGRTALIIGLCAVGAAMPLFIMYGYGGPGADHRVIWTAAQLTNPYEILFPYPPVILPFLWPFGLLPLKVSYWLFNAVSLAAFVWAARPYSRWLPAVIPGSVMCLAYGQTGLLVGTAWLLAFRHPPSVALLAIKPHMGILAIANLRSRRAWLGALSILSAMCAIPTIAYGPRIWVEWFERSRSFSKVAATWDHWDYNSVSALVHWGFWPWLVVACAAIYLLTKRFDVFTAATATLLISPYGFIYDTPATSLGIALALLNERSPIRLAILSAALLSSSLIMFGAGWVPAALLAALWVQVRQVEAPSGAQPSKQHWPSLRREHMAP